MSETDVASHPPPPPLRVLNVNAGNLYGGIEAVLRSFAVEAPTTRLAQSYALCYEGRLASELRELGAPVFVLGEMHLRSPLSVWRARAQLRSLLRRERFDVALFHSPWVHGLLSGVARRAGLPLAFFMHGPAVRDHWPSHLAARIPPSFVFYNSEFTRSASTVFADVPGRIQRYPLGPTRPCPPEDRRRLRASLGASEDDVVILQASRLDDWKGHRLHLDALARLHVTRPWRAWFAGGAQREEERATMDDLVARARSLGIADRVTFLGQRTDVPALMSAADVFCQPNTGPEPFGLVFIEALRAERPVVTTAMGGALEIVDDSCGALAEPDSSSVSRALASLVNDEPLRTRLGRAGPARAKLLCDPAARMRELEGSLRSVAERARAR